MQLIDVISILIAGKKLQASTSAVSCTVVREKQLCICNIIKLAKLRSGMISMIR
jgi:hypothetical protein